MQDTSQLGVKPKHYLNTKEERNQGYGGLGLVRDVGIRKPGWWCEGNKGLQETHLVPRQRLW